MKSVVATLALLVWPCVAVLLFATLSKVKATLWTIVGAQLLLPVGETIKFEMIPQFDKVSIPNLCILIPYLLYKQRQVPKVGVGLVELLIAVFLFGPVITSLLNNDPVVAGVRFIPGVGLYDGVSAIQAAAIILIPFFVGRGMFRSSSAIEETLKVLTIAGLAYSIPIFFEMRFSPQLHAWIYGYLPSQFIMQIRGDGYRPMVFMGHGLIAAIFMFMTACASAVFWRTGTRTLSLPAGPVAIYLGMVLVLFRSAGAAIFGAVIVPAICFAKPRTQSILAVALAVTALSYPILRFADLVPTSETLELVRYFSVERSDSLRVRFENEERLLDRALERPVFGWGRYGRSRVYDKDGTDISITDGRWAITIGQFGILGFLAEFGLLVFAVVKSASAVRVATDSRDKLFLSCLALLTSANIVDQLPNASLLPLTWLFAGALIGRSEALLGHRTRLPKLNTQRSVGRSAAQG